MIIAQAEHTEKPGICREDLSQRYIALQDQIENLYKDNALGQNQIDLLLTAYKGPFERNYSVWKMASYVGYDLKE